MSDDSYFTVFMRRQNGIYGIGKAFRGLICCFVSKHKAIWYLKEFIDGRLEF